jgi:hypothetical protein
MVVRVRQHVEAGPFQLRGDFRWRGQVASAAVGLRISLELVDHGLEVGNRHIGGTNLVNEAKKGIVADVRPWPDNDRVPRQEK